MSSVVSSRVGRSVHALHFSLSPLVANLAFCECNSPYKQTYDAEEITTYTDAAQMHQTNDIKMQQLSYDKSATTSLDVRVVCNHGLSILFVRDTEKLFGGSCDMQLGRSTVISSRSDHLQSAASNKSAPISSRLRQPMTKRRWLIKGLQANWWRENFNCLEGVFDE